MPDDELYDITILGAGPTGLFAAFYAGMREMNTKSSEALPEPGGQLAVLYPEKNIYDVPAYPKVLAKDLVEHPVKQTEPRNPNFVFEEKAEALNRCAHGPPA